VDGGNISLAKMPMRGRPSMMRLMLMPLATIDHARKAAKPTNNTLAINGGGAKRAGARIRGLFMTISSGKHRT